MNGELPKERKGRRGRNNCANRESWLRVHRIARQGWKRRSNIIAARDSEETVGGRRSAQTKRESLPINKRASNSQERSLKSVLEVTLAGSRAQRWFY